MVCQFNGIIPPVISCFDKEGRFDPARQRDIVRFLAQYVQGFYPCGTYGSGPLMSVEERKKVAEVVIREKGNTFVIVHVGTANTADTVELARHAEAAGADAVGAIPPYYYHYPQDALLDYYRTLIKAVRIPVFLYNNPDVSGNPITPDSLRILAEEGLAGVKDSAFDLVNLYLYMNKVKKPGFQFIVGTEAIAQPALDAGACGVIAGLANVFPELLADFWRTWQAGNAQITAQKQLKIVEARAVMKLGPTLTMTYAVLRMRGMDPGFPRLPWKDISPELYARAEKELRGLGLL
ncbi:MAG: dihydrodipicolinate synthase family protein [Spirochaetes bacterium]|nr:dihydrodipicolinate synthase family protein [Spirochaetota bacterium]